MGKKKSRVAKQKQAKKAKQNQQQRQGKKLGGIAVSKGINSKFQQSKSNSTMVVVDGPSKKIQLQQEQLQQELKKKIGSKQKKKVFLSPQPNLTVGNGSNTKYDEQKEFHRQMASMQERQMAAVQAKKRRNGSSKNGNNKGNDPFVSFQAASFSVEKSTQDLLQDASKQLQSMTGVGIATNITNTPIRTNQSWATFKDTSNDKEVLASKNPFAALGDDSDDETPNNEWNTNSSSFMMAPASFSLMPRVTPTPAATPSRFSEDDEYDPDL